ncbi:MAG: hypothetical protein CBC48_21955, partial [bacterium TMED88]
MHYDKTCCDQQSAYSDESRHCLESFPKLDYDVLVADLDNTLSVMTQCNSNHTCSNGIDFLEIVKQANNLFNITNGGATVGQTSVDHLQDQNVKLDSINSGELTTLNMKTGDKLILEPNATIQLDGAFALPNIVFTGTPAEPTDIPHMVIGEVHTTIDFNHHNLSNMNLELNTTKLNSVSLTATAAQLNQLQGVEAVVAAELDTLKDLTSTKTELNQLHATNLTASQAKMLGDIPIQYSESVTTIYAGTTEATFEIAKTKCTADHACDGYSESYPVVPTFTEYAGKKPTGTLGNKTTMSIEFNDITPCSSQLNSNSQNAIIVDSNELAPIYRADAKHYESDIFQIITVQRDQDFSVNVTECQQWALDNNKEFQLRGVYITAAYGVTVRNGLSGVPEGCVLNTRTDTSHTYYDMVLYNDNTEGESYEGQLKFYCGYNQYACIEIVNTCRDKAECESSCTTADEQCEGYTLDYTPVTEVAAG